MSLYEDPSLSGMSRLSAIDAPRKPSRCFRTSADGRIALTMDWLKLLAAARSLGRVAIQTRHAYARLVAFREVPEFLTCPEGGYAQAADGSLRFYFQNWSRAWGRLAECDCCGTPGRLEVHNDHALEFFQLCPIPGCEPAAWADFLAATTTGEVPPMAVGSANHGNAPAAFPRVPSGSRVLSDQAEQIVPLLSALGDDGIPLRCMMRTAEAIHSREFVTSHVDVTDGVLTAGEKGARLQIGLPAVRSLMLSMSAHGWMLHFAGPGEISLLALTASADVAAQDAWKSALRSAFSF
ncbi:MAG: hypothetical protein QM760_05410 [Nibricoccus sp.]